MKSQNKIHVKGTEIVVISGKGNDYISLTDIARSKNKEEPRFVVQNWMRARFTIEFMGFWEIMYNPNFNRVEFDTFRNESGSNSFVMTPQKWVEATQAVGIYSKSGRYGGGTFAHHDIAFEFASWISAEFKLYLIKEFQRLKNEENERLSLEWSLSRTLSKLNYHIHTEAVSSELIPPDLSKSKNALLYAGEADLLNLALFGKTAKTWRDENPSKIGNIRDYASLEQLIVLTNLESLNSVLIKQGLESSERLTILNNTAIEQITILIKHNSRQRLESSTKGVTP